MKRIFGEKLASYASSNIHLQETNALDFLGNKINIQNSKDTQICENLRVIVEILRTLKSASVGFMSITFYRITHGIIDVSVVLNQFTVAAI
jgi:hypothetical protein